MFGVSAVNQVSGYCRVLEVGGPISPWDSVVSGSFCYLLMLSRAELRESHTCIISIEHVHYSLPTPSKVRVYELKPRRTGPQDPSAGKKGPHRSKDRVA